MDFLTESIGSFKIQVRIGAERLGRQVYGLVVWVKAWKGKQRYVAEWFENGVVNARCCAVGLGMVRLLGG